MGYSAQGEGYNELGPDLPMMTPENQKLAFEAVHERLLPESVVREKASGGSWGSNGQKEWWYSWCDMNYLRTVAKTFIDILEHLGFDVQTDDVGNIISLWYNSKLGDEGLFLKETAEYWERGAVIDWTGEDSSVWRLDLDRGIEREGRVVYD